MAAFVPLSLIPAPATLQHSGTGAARQTGIPPWTAVSHPPLLRADSDSIDIRHTDVTSSHSPQRSLHPAHRQPAGVSPLQLLTAMRASTSPGSYGRPDAQVPPAVDASLAANSMLIYPHGALGAFAGAAFGRVQQKTPTAGRSVGADDDAPPPQQGLLLATPTSVSQVKTDGSRTSEPNPNPPSPDGPAWQPDALAAARPVEGGKLAERDAHLSAIPGATAAVPVFLSGAAQAPVPPPPPEHGLFFYTAPDVARIADAIRGGSPLRIGKEATSTSQSYMSRCGPSVTPPLIMSHPTIATWTV